MRINKFIASAGVCSRRNADELIKTGKIRVNENIVKNLDFKVQKTDIIFYNDKIIKTKKFKYIVLNKPEGYVTTTKDPFNKKIVTSLIKDCSRKRLFPIGRLDKNTTGLLLFTNDGDFCQKLCHPSYKIQKVYFVRLNKLLQRKDYNKIKEGLLLEDGLVNIDFINYISSTEIKLGIHIGKKRIIRRIFSHLGYRVIKLDRTIYANLKKGNLRLGSWRYLEKEEIYKMKKLIFRNQ